jgi:hypothetical protein
MTGGLPWIGRAVQANRFSGPTGFRTGFRWTETGFSQSC